MLHIVLIGGVIFLRFKRVKTALLQGISLFKDPTNFLTCPVFALAAALLMQTAPCKRLFPQFINNKRGAVCVEDVAELSLVELLETDEENIFNLIKTALLQGISLFKDPTNFLTCPVFALAAALLMQTAPCKRLFPQFINNKRGAVCVEDVAELSLVELLETDEENTPLQAEKDTPVKSRCPGAQANVNRLLSTVKLTPDLTSHSFRRGAAMHANDGSLAENWIIERGGWQLDRVKRPAGGKMTGVAAETTTRAAAETTRRESKGRGKASISACSRGIKPLPCAEATGSPLCQHAWVC
ncbi:Hypothetical protein PHPALM_6374 [Phytophthora palmivora]|uniref:Uncharacterized protein n=1 Tax=Phytophthora palmivora TaxID=4796 RepID=A0A2P4YF19_9STRA|nr:Hypothetical protein PHPALM_6374 [Phytophthora palmivora]